MFSVSISELSANVPSPMRHSIDMAGSFVHRESLTDEHGNQRSAEAIRRTQSQHMDIEYEASQMGEKNPILQQRRGTATGYAFSEDSQIVRDE